MTVLDRGALDASPLADLHAIASELTIDGYRRLRKAELISAIIVRQGGDPGPEPSADADRSTPVDSQSGGAEASRRERPGDEDQTAAGARRRRGRRGGRGRQNGREPGEAPEPEGREAPAAAATASTAGAVASAPAPEEPVDGVVELLPNGSGFLRVAPPDPSNEDVYISAAQVKRCELVQGDRVSGPRRAPQRSERFASMVRVDTINGVPAAEIADRTRFEDLPCDFPTERFRLGGADPTLTAIEFLTPFGRGSRVVLSGGRWAGKSHALRLLASRLITLECVTVFTALAGARPEELAQWSADGLPAPAAVAPLGSSADAQDHAVELVIEQARRIATRGGNAVVVIDNLSQLHPHAARKALAAARNLREAGSLTVIAVSDQPLGGETTVIALDSELTATGRYPALDLRLSGTLRADLLVGEPGALAIAQARAEALSE